MLGQQFQQGLLAGQTLGGQDLVGHEAVRAVVLLEKGLQQFGVGIVAVGEKIGQAAGDPAAPHQQDDDHGRVALPGQSQGVLILEIRGMGHLLGQGAIQQGQPVPEPGRVFEPQVRGRLMHLAGQLPPELFALALEKQQGLLGRLVVCLQGDQTAAGGQTLAHLVVQTGAGPLGDAPVPATAQAEDPLHEFQELPDRGAGGVGAEVAGPVRGKPADQAQAGGRVFEVQAETEEIFIIPEVDVVAGTMLLDEIALQDEGFPFRGGHQKIHLGEALHQEGGPGAGLVPEIGPHPVFQVDGLADVEHLTPGIFEEIDAGAGGKMRQGLGQGRGGDVVIGHGYRRTREHGVVSLLKIGLPISEPYPPNLDSV